MSQNSTPGAQSNDLFKQLEHHKPYYINGGDIHFLVEHQLFRVHRYFFERESSFFRDKLATPASPGKPAQGTSDSNAIVLEVKASEFERLLWVFYNPKYSLYETSVEDWSTILTLADQWSFAEVKSLAVRELEKAKMPPIDRIVLYHRFHIDENHLISRYAELCARDTPLSLEEGLKLGMPTALMLARAREIARVTPTESGARSPSPANLAEKDMHTIITDLFGIASPRVDNDSSSAGGLQERTARRMGLEATPAPVLAPTSEELVTALVAPKRTATGTKGVEGAQATIGRFGGLSGPRNRKLRSPVFNLWGSEDEQDDENASNSNLIAGSL